MSFSRPRLSHRFVCACLVAAAGVISAPSTGVARDGRRLDHEIDIPMLSAPTRQGFDEIIVQMAPLRPAPGAVAVKSAPASGVAQAAKPAQAEAQEIKPTPVAVQEIKPAPVVEAVQQVAAPKEAAKPEAAHVGDADAAKPATPQPARTAKDLDLKTGEPVLPSAPAVKSVDKPADQSAAQAPPVQEPKGLDLKIGEAAPSTPAPVAESAKPAEPAAAPAPAAQAAKSPDLKIAEAAKPSAPAPVAEAAKPAEPAKPVEAAKPAEPAAAPAPAAQAAKGPDLKIAEAAKPSAPAPIAESAKPAQAANPAESAATPAPAVQTAKGPDSKIAEAAKPSAPVAKPEPKPEPKPSVVAAAEPNAQVQTPVETSAQNGEKQAYAALLAQGVRGPVEVRLADRATLWLPANRVYLDGEQARKAFGAAQSWDNATQGVVLPTSSRPDWMAYVSLVDDGYIKDEDARSMDSAAILGAFKAQVAADNPARARQGLAALEVAGWMEAPRYDAKHRLSSCVRAALLGSQSPGDRFVNCSSFALGGQGAFKIVVSGEEASAPRFKGEASALAGVVAYDKGKGYEDADPATVKMAPYGLVALMTGGADFSKVAAARTAGAEKEPGTSALGALAALKFGGILVVGLGALLVVNRRMARKRQASPVEAEEEQQSAAPQELATEALQSEAPQEPAMEAQRQRGGLAAKFASLRAKLPSIPFSRKASEPAPAAAEAPPPAVAESLNEAPDGHESPAATLAKLAALMREKVLGAPPHVNLARFEKHAHAHAVHPLQGGAPLAAAKPIEEAAPERETTPALDPFALIEPGDEAAASMAASAREALRGAKG